MSPTHAVSNARSAADKTHSAPRRIAKLISFNLRYHPRESKIMKKAILHSLAAALLLLVGVTTASAGPIISIDLDPSTAGIQSALSVGVGAPFTIDVLIADDGLLVTPTLFDTVILEAFFNDAGAVLGLGPGFPLWGPLADNVPFSTVDFFGPALSGAPIPLTGTPAGVGPSSPGGGFASGSGAIGLLDPTLFTIIPGPPTLIFSVDFTALGAGTSTIVAAGTGPFGSPELALAGPPGIFAMTVPGTVTVMAPTGVPVPGTLLLLGIGLIGLVGLNRRLRGR